MVSPKTLVITQLHFYCASCSFDRRVPSWTGKGKKSVNYKRLFRVLQRHHTKYGETSNTPKSFSVVQEMQLTYKYGLKEEDPSLFYFSSDLVLFRFSIYLFKVCSYLLQLLLLVTIHHVFMSMRHGNLCGISSNNSILFFNIENASWFDSWEIN